MDRIAIPQPLGRPRTRPGCVAGDKGYSYRRIRRWLHSRGIIAVIPERDDPHLRYPANPRGFDTTTYRRRCIIEQCIGWMKECRRIGTRFEKLAINFLAMVKLAMIERYLRFTFSNSA